MDAPSPNHQMCLLLSRACLIQDVSNLVRHDNSRREQKKLQKKHEMYQKNTDAYPEALQRGPLGRSWGNLFAESVLDRTLDPFLDLFLVPFGELWRPFRLL